MLKPADELFSIPVFAMSHDPTPIGHALDDGGQRTLLATQRLECSLHESAKIHVNISKV